MRCKAHPPLPTYFGAAHAPFYLDARPLEWHFEWHFGAIEPERVQQTIGSLPRSRRVILPTFLLCAGFTAWSKLVGNRLLLRWDSTLAKPASFE